MNPLPTSIKVLDVSSHSFYTTPNYGLGKSCRSRRDRKWRAALFAKQGGKCYWCGSQMELFCMKITSYGNIKDNSRFATFEHLIPRSHKGTNQRSNLVLAHGGCNNKRHLRKWPHDPIYGGMAERPIAPVLKTDAPTGAGSSNLPPSANQGSSHAETTS